MAPRKEKTCCDAGVDYRLQGHSMDEIGFETVDKFTQFENSSNFSEWVQRTSIKRPVKHRHSHLLKI